HGGRRAERDHGRVQLFRSRSSGVRHPRSRAPEGDRLLQAAGAAEAGATRLDLLLELGRPDQRPYRGLGLLEHPLAQGPQRAVVNQPRQRAAGRPADGRRRRRRRRLQQHGHLERNLGCARADPGAGAPPAPATEWTEVAVTDSWVAVATYWQLVEAKMAS